MEIILGEINFIAVLIFGAIASAAFAGIERLAANRKVFVVFIVLLCFAQAAVYFTLGSEVVNKFIH